MYVEENKKQSARENTSCVVKISDYRDTAPCSSDSSHPRSKTIESKLNDDSKKFDSVPRRFIDSSLHLFLNRPSRLWKWNVTMCPVLKSWDSNWWVPNGVICFQNASKSCKQATRNVSEMSKELEIILQTTDTTKLHEKMEKAKYVYDIEVTILEKVTSLINTDPEWSHYF